MSNLGDEHISTVSPLAFVVFGDFRGRCDRKNFNRQEMVVVFGNRRYTAFKSLATTRAIDFKRSDMPSPISYALKKMYGNGMERRIRKQQERNGIAAGHYRTDQIGEDNFDCCSRSPNGGRCKLKRLPGHTLCASHAAKVNPSTEREVSKLASAYSQHLGPTLRERFAQHTAQATYTEQLALYDEIGLARMLATEQLKIYNTLHEAIAANKPGVTHDHLSLAGRVLQEALDHIAGLCARMSQIEKNMAENVSLAHVAQFADQMTMAIHEVLGDNESSLQVVEAIDRHLRTRMRLPNKLADELIEINCSFVDNPVLSTIKNESSTEHSDDVPGATSGGDDTEA